MNNTSFDYGSPSLREEIVHYTHVYPEIMGWVFNEEVSRIDPAAASNSLFMPTFPHKNYVYLQPVEAGETHYSNLLEILPNLDARSLFIKIQGVKTPNDKGRIRMVEDTTTFGAESLMGVSLNMLYDRLQMNLGADAEDFIFQHPSKTVGAKMEPLRVGNRFFKIYNILRKEDLVYLVFILYYLQGNIV